jgi:hypothetical protein
MPAEPASKPSHVETRPLRRADGTWTKGVSGNPRGRHHDAVQITKLAKVYAPHVLKELFVIAMTSNHTPSRVAALREILDRAIGKSVQGITVSGPDGGPVRLAPEVLATLTDKELLALRSVAAKVMEAAARGEPRAIEASTAGAPAAPGAIVDPGAS